ncbi:hypothetical protein [Vibrio casei]|uniref:hypothetical protein n=1 Tax=Vibrio casei TaxID=673372 RepID=UPI0013A62E0D|nr:hypothetical protein [Vibrio casei]
MIIDYNIARQLAQAELLKTLTPSTDQYRFEMDIYQKLVSGEIQNLDSIKHYNEA